MGRVERIGRLIESYDWGDTRVDVLLSACDAQIPSYLDRKWPAGFKIQIEDILYCGPLLNWAFDRYQREKFYGVLTDDMTLDTPGILATLEAEAGAWNIAYANDGENGAKLCALPCIGGELARAMGFLAPPGFKHDFLDNCWLAIGHAAGKLRYREDCRITHHHPYFNRAKWDATYLNGRVASEGAQDVLLRWAQSGELGRTVDRIREREKRAA